MLYHVCVENCYEDFYSESLDSIGFASLEKAKKYIAATCFSTFSAQGEIRWYFPGCQADGTLIDPDETEGVECYQIINVIPSEREKEMIDASYSDDERSAYSIKRYYVLDCRGNVEWVDG